ncbi:uncharacterized protein LOC133451328 [Cololabis saira]|uniref:uncharacterized protein LOC133451328 n=1 Tax=Cololabis saira TaxID=129043 RepID=UPI002AD38D6A|nr:uncharacterized protein LOC133451328 [Cololabis saira]
MDGLRCILIAAGIDLCCHFWVSGSLMEVTVKPGDNITLYCDCKVSTGVYIAWFRNCSHEKQPRLVLNVFSRGDWNNCQKPPRYEFVNNSSSDSHDLLIMNISDSDEGLYYCGTKEERVEEKLTENIIYNYGYITTRIKVDINKALQDHDLCWNLVLYLCPAVSVLSALLSSLLVYKFCQKTDSAKRRETRYQTSKTQAEDVCYAALEIRPGLQRSERRTTTQSSDFCTYSAIKPSQV